VGLKFAIKTLEKDCIPLIDVLKCIDDAKYNLPFGTPGSAARKIYSKMLYVLEKNEGLKTLRSVSTGDKCLLHWGLQHKSHFKVVPPFVELMLFQDTQEFILLVKMIATVKFHNVGPFFKTIFNWG
jgi:hypothetical protein